MNRIIHGDCLKVMKELSDNSVDAVVTDPPYFRVKNEAWDRQWKSPDKFIEWIGQLCEQWQRLLKQNGSLYVFASPRMSARVECKIAERFNILNRIRWIKKAGWHKKANKESLRKYLSPWEGIIFAEHYGADNNALGLSGYQAKCDELRGFVFEPLRKYLDDERKRAGIGKDECNEACGFSRCAGGMASRHYFSQSQWCLPTERHYQALRELFNRGGGEYLRREYEDLRREYEYLRREYEYLRRPFAALPETIAEDVWHFDTVPACRRRHSCEKPVKLMEHIITMSTRPEMVILDCFAGTGATLVAANNLNRKYLGIELNPEYIRIAEARIAEHTKQGRLI